MLIGDITEILDVLKAQHQAIDLLFSMLMERDRDFFPSKSGQPWEAIQKGNTLIQKLSGELKEPETGDIKARLMQLIKNDLGEIIISDKGIFLKLGGAAVEILRKAGELRVKSKGGSTMSQKISKEEAFRHICSECKYCPTDGSLCRHNPEIKMVPAWSPKYHACVLFEEKG